MELCKCDQGYKEQLNYVLYSIDKNSWNNHLFFGLVYMSCVSSSLIIN